ncbi:TetR/AcrR family transcriptional regulator [Williamsia sterculiae]|uniref:Transcriptional regulator, TetR family n=1 Tax=Williamsia sterculiae TaxID=1344003 RepID=A0A1N7F293_9NOCA|nr:TetR family transcriptional regulator [Williamsia sterculiae]SIR94335.1 transcriptional regulator, TetR family [Williamsia sterculiae]
MERDRLVDVGVGVISRFGARALSLTSVARHAGVGRATAYRMFGGRDALVAAIVDREVAVLSVHLGGWAAEKVTPEDKVRNQVVNVLAYIREHQALQYVLRNEPEEIAAALVSGPDSESRSTVVDRIIDVCMPTMDPAFAEVAIPDPRSAAELMVRIIYTFMLIPNTAMTDEQLADAVVRATIG